MPSNILNMKQNTLLRISDLKINWEKLKLVDWKYSPHVGLFLENSSQIGGKRWRGLPLLPHSILWPFILRGREGGGWTQHTTRYLILKSAKEVNSLLSPCERGNTATLRILRTKANLAALSSHDNYLIVNYSTDFVLNHNPDSKSMCHFAEWCFGINRVWSS